MKEKRRWQNEWLRGIAQKQGLLVGQEIVIRERSLMKDYSYITREIRYGTVLALYPYHFLCQMADGTKESFRYNEFLGREARLIRLKKERQCAVSLFLGVDFVDPFVKIRILTSLCRCINRRVPAA